MDVPDGQASPGLELMILAGRLMLECGAETSRVEETMTRIGAALGFDRVDALCTPTGIMTSARSGDRLWTHVARVQKRGIDLSKVAQVNAVSRKLEEAKLDLDGALILLRDVEGSRESYSYAVRLVTRGLSTACFAVLLGGSWHAFLPSMLAGFLVHVVYNKALEMLPNFLAIFFGALLGTLWAVLTTVLGFGADFRQVVIGVILPLVPGLALTNAVRDLIAGDLLSGVARAAEALLTAVAIAAGVWTVLESVRWTVWF